jgi:hypothetical protein
MLDPEHCLMLEPPHCLQLLLVCSISSIWIFHQEAATPPGDVLVDTPSVRRCSFKWYVDDRVVLFENPRHDTTQQEAMERVLARPSPTACNVSRISRKGDSEGYGGGKVGKNTNGALKESSTSVCLP